MISSYYKDIKTVFVLNIYYCIKLLCYGMNALDYIVLTCIEFTVLHFTVSCFIQGTCSGQTLDLILPE